MKRVAECHPDRPHLARGKCSPCYWRQRYSEPGFAEKRKAYRAQYDKETSADPEAVKARLAYQRERSRLRSARNAKT